MKVNLFIPCFIEQFYPETASNTKKILAKAGCEVQYNPQQTCCGQPAFNSGFWKEARKLAKKYITDFGAEFPVVTPSGSCSGYVRNYFKILFENEPEWRMKAEGISPNVFELSDFLVNQLNFTDFGSTFPFRVTFHDSCAGLREYGIRTEPRKLLEKVKGLELVEMEQTDTCCGFGGTFAVKFHNISTAMTQQKVEHALNTGAKYIVSTEGSCLLNINSYIIKQNLPLKTIHFTDILAKF